MYLNFGLKGSFRCAILGVTITLFQCCNVESLEKKKKKKSKKQKQSNRVTWKATVLVRANILSQEKIFLAASPPRQKKTQQNKDINKKRKRIQNKTLSQKTIIIKTARRRGYKRTTFMSTPSCINTYCERNEGELNDFIA